MVGAGPSVGALGQTSVCEVVQGFLVGIVLTAEEDEVLQDVGQTVVVLGLCWKAEVAIYDGSLRLGNSDGQTWRSAITSQQNQPSLYLSWRRRIY